MHGARLAKKVFFYGELQEGKRSQGWPEETLQRHPQSLSEGFEIPKGTWEQTAQERAKWRGLINKGTTLYEKMRICQAERKRRERKAKTNGSPVDSMILACSTCMFEHHLIVDSIDVNFGTRCFARSQNRIPPCRRAPCKIVDMLTIRFSVL